MWSPPTTRTIRDHPHTSRTKDKPKGTRILYESMRPRVSRLEERVC